jgi:hypothetical protein
MRPRVGENNEERLSFPASPEKTTRINGPWPPLEIQRGTIHVSLRSVRRDARPAGCRLSRPQPLEKQRGTILSPGHAARRCELKRPCATGRPGESARIFDRYAQWLGTHQPLWRRGASALSGNVGAALRDATDSNEVQFRRRRRLRGAAGDARARDSGEPGYVRSRRTQEAEDGCPGACIKLTEHMFSCQGQKCSPCSKRE